MTTNESYKKFGLETRTFVGGILTAVGCGLFVMGLSVFIVDQSTGNFGLEGVPLIFSWVPFWAAALALCLPECGCF